MSTKIAPRLRMDRRRCLERWWPDQAAGALLVLFASRALFAGQAPIDGVGLSDHVPTGVMVAWFAALGVAGGGLVVLSTLDHPWCMVVCLWVVGVLLGANVFATLAANGDDALGAAIAYGVAAIYSIHRADLSVHTHFDRLRARRIAAEILDDRQAPHAT